MKEINDIIEDIANKYHKQIIKLGYVLPGRNGPYNDNETPVRNTAHALMIFRYMYDLTEDSKYYEAIIKAANYLVSDEARPMKATFYCRKNREKDLSNGLIGQAWVIEGLAEAFKVTSKEEYLNQALEVFLLHPFDYKKGLWKIVNVDGSIKSFDMTFNHQLWFAASGAILYNLIAKVEIKKSLDVFFHKLDNNLSIYNCGLIKHKIAFTSSLPEKIILSARLFKYSLIKYIKNKSMIYKENGYHIFNVYAFALIKDHGFEYDFFETNRFSIILDYAFSNKLMCTLQLNNYKSDINHLTLKDSDLDVNRYGFPYNSPGFELAYIYQIFKGKLDYKEINIDKILKKHIDLTYDYNKKSFSRNTEDEATLTARIYELTRCLDKNYLEGA
ncbi:MAG: hypothetical protein ACOCRK_06265 [bacterium]